ncbi:RDD family protein [Gordonia sp. VNQ95]|uniref:RDD family protein n=1 Tax=Gordonia sp. VNQ95 TaxID=3156619 RepID=UPI0032B546C8
MAEPQPHSVSPNPDPDASADDPTPPATVTPLHPGRPASSAAPSVGGSHAHHVPASEPGTNQILDTDRPAGIVSRGIGAVVDVLVVVVVMGGMYVGFIVARLIYNVQGFSLPETNPFFTVGAFVLVSLLYLTSCWAVSGRTAGSVVMGLRLVSRKGKPRVRPSVAFVRALICVFFSVGLLWVAVDRNRRSAADLVVRTRVMYSR